jgi:hypothetical protein
MGEALAKIILARVQMRINMEQAQRLPDTLLERAQQGKRDAVFAAKGEQMGEARGLFFNQCQAFFHIAQRDFKFAKIGKIKRCGWRAGNRVPPIGQHAGSGADGAGAIACAGAVGGANIKRHTGDAEGSAPVMRTGTEEGMRGGKGDGRGHEGLLQSASPACPGGGVPRDTNPLGGGTLGKVLAERHSGRSALAFHHQLLDLTNRLRRVQALGAGARAVHDGVAAIEPEGVFQIIQALAGRFIA